MNQKVLSREGSQSRTSTRSLFFMTTKQTPADIHLFCAKIYEARNYFQNSFEWEKEKDARIAIFDKWINLTNSVELSTFFLVRHLRDDKWWAAFGSSIVKSNQSIRKAEYEKFNRISFIQLTFSSIESSFRTILKAIDPDACLKGTDSFENIYKTLLKRTNLEKYENVFKLMRLFRNTIHNNSFYFHKNNKDDSVVFRGIEYKFEIGKPINFASWDFIISIQEDLLSAITEIIKHRIVSSIPLIVDPGVQTKYVV